MHKLLEVLFIYASAGRIRKHSPLKFLPMKKRNFAALLSFLLIMFMSGCDKDEESGPTGRLEGTLYYQGTEVPVYGVSVSVGEQVSVSDSTGYYFIAGAPAGNQILHATKAGYDPYSANVNIPRAGIVHHIEMTSPAHTHGITGSVYNQFGQPLPDIKVVILNPDGEESRLMTTSGENGSYALSGVPEGNRTIVFDAEKIIRQETDLLVAGGNEQLDADLFVWGLPCGDMKTVTYEGQVYHTVMIGDQCWLRENLDVGTMLLSCGDMSDDGVIEKYCLDDDPLNCEKYGGLYQWDEAMDYSTAPGSRGICPPGWHIPADEEWQELVDFLGEHAGRKLKSLTGWETSEDGATNISGFSAFGGGYRGGACNLYYNEGIEGRWWTSTEDSHNGAWRRTMYHDNASVPPNRNFKYYGISVRCVRSTE